MTDTAIELVERINWRVNRPQRWHDSWRNTDRICRYHGRCIVCHRRCYGFDDGENDPRGMLGDHAVSWLSPTDDAGLVAPAGKGDTGRHDPDVVICFMCANDYDAYHAGMREASRIWRRAGWRLP